MARRIAIRGRNLDALRKLLVTYPVEIVEQNPDWVVSHGGDGALLGAEREFPGIPKIPVRDRGNNPPCPEHDETDILQLAFSDRLRRFEVAKVEARIDGVVATALNDISIHRLILPSAVRFKLALDGELHASQIVGDGLIVATPFGSTGYYRSITHSIFKTGLGLAFNNTTEPIDHLVVAGECLISVEILRGPAVLVADNDPRQINLLDGDVVTFRQAQQRAIVYGLDILRCRECLRTRQKLINRES